jgi:hypothetical protein
MKEHKRRVPVPQDQVLAWLLIHYPQLHADAAVDRNWVWLTTNLSGEANRQTREAIKAFGFRFAKHFHTLPDGRVGTWGHCCTTPIPFRHHKGAAGSTGGGGAVQREEPEPDETLEAAALAFALGQAV